ncbi:MAG TPA: galactokinase family protein, partial [Bacteroidales bacterium]|nr:galactokinase family protein [Bacteroidales bacterium]
MDQAVLLQRFFELYKDEQNKPQLYFAPGRVNLIGEHTDYNGGFVLPCAIQFGTYLLIRKTEDKIIWLTSMNFPEQAAISLAGPLKKQESGWCNYPLGVMAQFEKAGKELSGMELLFFGDIPNGAGLSSSASIEVVTAFAVNDMLDLQFELPD